MNVRFVRLSILLADLVWLALGLLIAEQFRFGFQPLQFLLAPDRSGFPEILVIALLVWPVLYLWLRLDGFRGGWNFPAVFSQVISGVFVLVSLVLAAAYLSKEFYSRLVILHYAYLLVIGFVGIRYFARRAFQSRYAASAKKRVVILGSGSIAKEIAARIRRHPEMMREVVGFLSRKDEAAGLGLEVEYPPRHTPLRPSGILEFLQREDIKELIVAFSDTDPETSAFISQCRLCGIRVTLIPMFYELYISQPEFSELDGLPLVSLQDFRLPTYMLPAKRALDLLFSALLLVLASPVLLAAWVALGRRGGPAFKSVPRAGKGGHPFAMLRLNISREAGVPSRTWLEAFVVRFSLTELPQLWNVFRGEMSLVGPRPESPERVKHYSDWQKHRLKLRPGLTGLAQVHGLREEHSSDEKTRFDLQYMLQWSPILDISLLLQTGWTLANRSLSVEQAPESVLLRAAGVDVVVPAGDPALNQELVHVDRT